MEYRSTDFASGASAYCVRFLRMVLEAPRVLVVPPVPDNIEPIPLIIAKYDGRVHLIEVMYADDMTQGRRRSQRYRYAMVLSPVTGSNAYVFEYEFMEQRANVFQSIALGWKREVNSVTRKIV